MKKKLILILSIVSLNLFSQEQFNIGINGGITSGDVKEFSDFGFGADVNYLFDIFDNVVVGPSVALMYFNLDSDVDADAPAFLPISAAVRFNSLDDAFYAGVDLGYGVSISGDADGGVYLKPIIGYNLSDSFKVNAFYSSVRTSDPNDFSFFGLGLTYNLKGRQNSRY